MLSGDLAERLRGRFLVFDGPDGCGKTTQGDRLAAALREYGIPVVRCRDPGGTKFSDLIRHVLLDFDLSNVDVRCETLLFMASRAQLVGEVIEPALRRGETVLCDRFISSTCAYQGAAGFDPRRVVELGHFAVGDTWPDLTIILDVPVEVGFGRTGRSAKYVGKRRSRHAAESRPLIAGVDDGKPDAMEARPIEFHRRVRELFLQVPQIYPRRVEVVDADAPPEIVHARVLEAIGRVYA